jgi:hypothetical protein
MNENVMQKGRKSFVLQAKQNFSVYFLIKAERRENREKKRNQVNAIKS